MALRRRARCVPLCQGRLRLVRPNWWCDRTISSFGAKILELQRLNVLSRWVIACAFMPPLTAPAQL
jgi:phage gp46-like protein